MQRDLLPDERSRLEIGDGASLLRGFARGRTAELAQLIQEVARRSPFRHLETPGGRRMSVAMTNCGTVGWVSDRSGYRYDPIDPLSAMPWPDLPAQFQALAARAAKAAGYDRFEPDACLINRYEAGARLSLHRDQDEEDLDAPIVSLSIGLPATFLWGGAARADPVRRIPVGDGDAVVWGGPSRLTYHGVAPLRAGTHPATGAVRYNLTFRKVFRLPRTR